MSSIFSMQLRDYQKTAIHNVKRSWESHRATCLVAPTGSGKTIMGVELSDSQNPLWIVHRRELVHQTKKAIPRARVETIQSLLNRDPLPICDRLIVDECHHHAPGSPEWNKIINHYKDIQTLGLTATPQRQDGSPLGDVFQDLVVAASYSELIKLGHLVDCIVYRPDITFLDSEGLAASPIDAYKKYGNNKLAFCFASLVDTATKIMEGFNAQGIASKIITGKTPGHERDLILKQFADGGIRVLSNVFTMTEGVDIPQATVCILSRGCQHQGTFIQMVGRVLRPYEGKEKAILIDLTGVTYKHGLPTDDRLYTLDDKGIKSKIPALKNCPQCGCTIHSVRKICPECGYVFPVEKVTKNIKIWDLDLKRVYAGKDTPIEAKQTEWNRLRDFCNDKGWGLSWAIKEYRKLFPDETPLITMEEKQKEYIRLKRYCDFKGYKPGWVGYKYKATFGHWPGR